MADRTEGAGVSAGTLTVTMGGQPYQLRVLTIEKAEAWQALMARLASGMTIDGAGDPASIFTSLMRKGTDVGMEALRAYDDAGAGALGGVTNIRARMSPPELKAALEVVVAAAVPFDEDASRSVAMAFGGPSRVLATTLMSTMAQVVMARAQAPSTPTRSDAGASATTGSGPSGPPSSSSSDGSTAMNGTDSTPSTGGTSWPTA